MSQQTTNRSFDELTRGLASGSISRSKAIRLMGAALVGGTLASFPGVAWAAKGGRNSCAKFCQSLFGANTPEEAECVSAARTGQGPCFTCTTETGCGPNFTRPPCTVTGQTYSCSTCQCKCPSGQEVCGGRCGTSNGGTCTSANDCCSGNCSLGFCCPSGYVSLSNGTCVRQCILDSQCPGCSGGCVPVAASLAYCSNGGGSNAPCGSSGANCPPGEFCGASGPAIDPKICHAAC